MNHETKGLIVLDDLEAIGARPGKDGASSGDLVQWLEVSYRRTEMRTSPASASWERESSFLNCAIFFPSGGIRLISASWFPLRPWRYKAPFGIVSARFRHEGSTHRQIARKESAWLRHARAHGRHAEWR